MSGQLYFTRHMRSCQAHSAPVYSGDSRQAADLRPESPFTDLFMCFPKWKLRDETQEDSWDRGDLLASLSRDLALIRLLVKVNIFHMKSSKV